MNEKATRMFHRLLVALALLPVLSRAEGLAGSPLAPAAAHSPLAIDAWLQAAKLTASDGAAWDDLGIAVAISGDTVVVGADLDDMKGSVYVFTRPGGGWADMTQTAKLTASDGASPDSFGNSVAISGDTVVVGSFLDDVAYTHQGSAYVFVEPGGGWADMTQTAKLTAGDGAEGDNLGRSVVVDGDTVVVGADLHDVGGNDDQGATYVFEKPGGGWGNMTETAKLTAGDGATGDVFGCSVSAAGDTLVVGAWGDDSDKGSAYVFAYPPFYVDPAGLCNGLSPCYTTIGAAVAAANPGEILYVFPGAYAESVDLGSMTTPGDISLLTVDASGAPTPGAATVSPASGPAFYSAPIPFPGNITLDGFIVTSPDDDGIDVGVNSDVIVRHVTANGAAGDGIYVYQASGNVEITDCTTNDNAGGGVEVLHVTGNVTISGSTANGNGDNGIAVWYVGQSVVIGSSTANENGDDGLDVWDVGQAVTLSACTAGQNDDDGIDVDDVGGSVTLSGCTASHNGAGAGVEDGVEIGEEVGAGGDVTISHCTADGNDDDGFEVDGLGDATAADSSADGNGDDGFDLDVAGDVTVSRCTGRSSLGGVPTGHAQGFCLAAGGDVTVSRCTAGHNPGADSDGFVILASGNVQLDSSIATGNGDEGLQMENLAAGAYQANGSLLCGNGSAGLYLASAVNVNAEGNWWGDASGPAHPGNPGGVGDAVVDGANGGAGAVDYAPWIDTITATASLDPVNVGQPSIIHFQFSGGGAVFLGQGPGDPNFTPPFTLTTDNGLLVGAAETGAIIHESIGLPAGILSVTLLADAPGAATVTLTGPCGLAGDVSVQVEGGVEHRVYLPLVLRSH